LSAVRECLFNIFAATVHIGGRSSIRNLRTRHAVVTVTHLSQNTCQRYLRLRFIIALTKRPNRMNVTGPKIFDNKQTLKKATKRPHGGTPPTRSHSRNNPGHYGKLANHSDADDSIHSSRKCAWFSFKVCKSCQILIQTGRSRRISVKPTLKYAR
jgi:hypothetical protein